MIARKNGKSRTAWNQMVDKLDNKVDNTLPKNYGMALSFFLPMDPPTVTHQEKSIRMVQKSVKRSDGKIVRKAVPVVYEDERLKDARQKLLGALAEWKRVHIRDAWWMETEEEKASAGAVLFEKGVPVRLAVKWCFRISEAERKAGRKLNGEYRVTKPDTDNLEKLLKDCMTEAGFWADDAQVCSEIAEKFWSDVPGLFISVMALDPREWCDNVKAEEGAERSGANE